MNSHEMFESHLSVPTVNDVEEMIGTPTTEEFTSSIVDSGVALNDRE